LRKPVNRLTDKQEDTGENKNSLAAVIKIQ